MIEATLLGKRTEYPKEYSPSILVAVPRHLNREIYGIDSSNLPFVGSDTWHAYEISWLTDKGMPVVGLLKSVYDASSPFIVESKSLKLYLNSLNMFQTSPSDDYGMSEIERIITNDLANILKAEVSLHIFLANHTSSALRLTHQEYSLLEEMPECRDTLFTQYTETPTLLKVSNIGGTRNYITHLLRSNCKITHQPDWGSMFIHITSSNLPVPQSLLQYIVSLRGENHFHEEICELVYIRLKEYFNPSELAVTCIYTRRGGIDICPCRASSQQLLSSALTDARTLTEKLLRQ